MAEEEGVDILAIDDRAARDGIGKWHDPACGIAPSRRSATAAPMYGDLVGAGSRPSRGARSSAWCWTSTIRSGAASSATTAWRASSSGRAARWARPMSRSRTMPANSSRRGVILAVCSKNDEANALEPFEKHPDMVLRRGDIASFVANWSNKADNIRAIAAGTEHRPGFAGVHRRQPVRAEPGAPGTADGRGAGGVGRPDRLSGRAGRRRLFRGPCGHRGRPRADQPVSGQQGARRAEGLGDRPAGLSARAGDATDLEARSTGSGCSGSCN